MPKVYSNDEVTWDANPQKSPKVYNSDEVSWDEAPSAPARVPFSAVESGLTGALQVPSFGLSDEIEGAIRAPGAFIRRGDYSFEGLKSAYEERRDAARERDKQAFADNPGAYIAGGVGAGALTSALIPATAVPKAIQVASPLAKSVVGGMLSGYGSAEENPLTGTLAGGALGGVLSGLGSAAGKVGEWFNKLPEERAVKAVTGQNISALRKAADITHQSAGDLPAAEAKIQRLGKDLLDEGVIGGFDTVRDIAPKVAQARDKYGKLIGQIGEKIDEVAPNAVNARNIADKMTEYAASLPETEVGKTLQNKLLNEAANFESKGAMPFYEAQLYKNQFKYKPQDADALISNQDVTNKIQRIIAKEMDDTAARVSAANPNSEISSLLDQYQNLKGKYGTFKKASDAAADRSIKDLSNRFVSPSDYGVGGAALLSQGMSPAGVAAGVIGAGANKVLRERGNAMASNAALALRNVLQKDGVQAFMGAVGPVMQAAKGGDANAVLTLQLLKSVSPEWKQIFGDL